MSTIATDREIRAAKSPSGKPTDFVVKGAPGLRVRVMASGFKSWSLIYTRMDGKKRRVSLGEYPVMGLKEAKEEAQRFRAQIREGKDPSAVKQEARVAMTFARLAENYISRHAMKNKRSWKEDERKLRRDLLPALGHIRADAVTKREVIAVLDRKAYDNGAGYAANRLKSLVHSIYSWAIAEDLVSINPAAGIKPRIKEEARGRTLTDAEIKRFWLGLDAAAMMDGVRDVLRLALLTGQRVNEITGAEVSEFDFENGVWTIPGSRTKNKRTHAVPLPPLALAMFKDAFSRSGGQYAFPSRAARTGPLGRSAATGAWRRVRKDFGVSDIHVHDLRRTFATGLGNMDHDDFAIGLCLNHQGARSKITGEHYNQAKYLAKKRHLFAAWEAKLIAILEDRELASNVVALPRI